MSSILGGIFGFGDKMKRRLRDAVSNPRDYLEMTADENQNEWRKNPEERSMGFFNPVPLGKVDPFLLRKQMKKAIDELPSLSRRDFMKKSAGLAAGSTVGAGVTAKLLRKFAPEEKQIAKQAAVEAAPKYKYNSLKEYLDDVSSKAETEGFERATGEATELGAYNQPGYDSLHEKLFYDKHYPSAMKERLLQDEEAHNTAKFFYKDNLKDPTTGKWIDPYTGQPHSEEFLKNIRNTTDDFSPQAKKEMKALKDEVRIRQEMGAGGGDWADIISNKSNFDSMY